MNAKQNLKAFSMLIRECEGTVDPQGYQRRHNGNRSNGVLFNSFRSHPCVIVAETNSSAAGAYQITCSTWRAIQAVLKLPDFSPASQDAAFVLLLKWRNAYQDVINGRFDAAIQKCRKEWTSLPGASQTKKTLAQARSIIQQYGGAAAA
jgi:muramidase (phage lysozyme)